MLNKLKLKKPLALTLSWCIVLSIWCMWFLSGLKGAMDIHHRIMWRKFSSTYSLDIAFAPIVNDQGEVKLHSIAELTDPITTRVASFLPPPGFRGRPPRFKQLVEAYYQNRSYHFGKVRAASIEEVGSKDGSNQFMISVYYTQGSEWRWRYNASPRGIEPLEWYEIHDTAGVVLFQMALGIWAVLFPLAFFGSRLVFRIQKRIQA